ncbi:MAG: hypothetical protein ACRDT0_20140 [Pseudonocardiaceae bacterium]
MGRREAEQQTVSVRYRSGEETAMTVDAFIEHALDLVRSKSLEGAGLEHVLAHPWSRGCRRAASPARWRRDRQCQALL